MDKIEKIRQFVKELQQDFISIHPKDCSLELIKSYAGYAYLDKVLSFLDTLSEELDNDDLNEEIKKLIEKYGYERGGDRLLIAIVARHFAEWGAEHLRDSTKMIDKSLEEAAEKYRRESYNKSVLPNIDGPMPEYGGSIKDAFKAGAEWAFGQGETVEGTLGYGPHLQRPIIHLEGVPSFYDGHCQEVIVQIRKK